MTVIRHQQWAIAPALFAVLLLAACKGGGPPQVVKKRNVPLVLSEKDPQFVYNTKCASCHGPALEGADGPPLLALATKMDEMAVLEVLARGKAHTMAAGIVQGETAFALARWLLAPRAPAASP